MHKPHPAERNIQGALGGWCNSAAYGAAPFASSYSRNKGYAHGEIMQMNANRWQQGAARWQRGSLCKRRDARGFVYNTRWTISP